MPRPKAWSIRSKAMRDDMPSRGRSALIATVGTCVDERAVSCRRFLPRSAAHRVGHTLMVRDPDGPVAPHFPFVRAGDGIVPVLSVAAVLLAEDAAWRSHRAGANVPPPLIAYRGPTLGDQAVLTFSDYSFYDSVLGEQQILAGRSPRSIRRSSRIGSSSSSATASGTYEVQTTPFAQGIAAARCTRT